MYVQTQYTIIIGLDVLKLVKVLKKSKKGDAECLFTEAPWWSTQDLKHTIIAQGVCMQ